MEGYKNKMYKLLLAITVGGFVFAGSGNNTTATIKTSNFGKDQICLSEDTSKDDYKLERRRGGKGSKKRRRGGSGLR